MVPKSIRMKSMETKPIGMVCELNVVVGGKSCDKVWKC